MSVANKHRDYARHHARVEKVRDALDGEEQIKSKKERYLPRLSGHTNTPRGDKLYESYLNRAPWFGATARTHKGMSGLVAATPPVVVVEAGDEMSAIETAATTDGVSLADFAEDCVDELLVAARVAVLVDHPAPAGERTVAEARQASMRPYLSLYKSEDIINWRYATTGGERYLVLVVLREDAEEIIDEFESELIEQYRVLSIDDGRYRVRLYRKMKDKDEYELYEEYWPKARSGQPITRIPLKIAKTGREDLPKPPLLDLANVNLAHYRVAADLSNAQHRVGTPTPVFSGRVMDPSGEEVTEIRMGSDEGINLELGGDAKMLEFTGQGLESLERGIDKHEQQAALLGARIISQEKRQAETSESAEIHRAGENSVLATIANRVSDILTQALAIARDWINATGDVSIQLNTDFGGHSASPQAILAMVASWQGSAVSRKVLFNWFKAAGIVADDYTYEDLLADLEEEGPALGDMTV